MAYWAWFVLGCFALNLTNGRDVPCWLSLVGSGLLGGWLAWTGILLFEAVK